MSTAVRHSPVFLGLQKARLLRDREEIVSTIHSATQAAAIEKHEGRSVQDIGDVGSAATDTDLALVLSEKSHSTLRDIDDALRRIDKGTYGICELTGDLISTERLEALPFARCTIKAQRDRENNSHRSRGYGAVFDEVQEPEEDGT